MLSVVSATRPIGGSYRREASTGICGGKAGSTSDSTRNTALQSVEAIKQGHCYC